MKYEILNTQIYKKQKEAIRKECFKRKLSQAKLVREIIDNYFNDDEESSLRNQDLGDEPTLPGEDEPLED